MKQSTFRHFIKITALTLVPLSVIANTPAPVIDANTYDQRLERLESRLDANREIRLLNRIQTLQQEVQELRGLLEEQTYQIEQVTKRQRQLYLDLDKRLSEASKSKNVIQEKEPLNLSNNSYNLNNTIIRADMTEQQAYQTAFQFIQNKDHYNAVEAFQQFLAAYPTGQFAPNGHYWLGELYLKQKRLDDALMAFQHVYHNFPAHQKAADSFVKSGFTYLEKGNNQKARDTFQAALSRYPGSSAAQIALTRLNQMN